MRKYNKKLGNQCRTLDINPRRSGQAPMSKILQAYKNGTLGRQSVQQGNIEDEDLLQTKRLEFQLKKENSANFQILQRAPIADLMSGQKEKIIAGEIHNEIDPKKEMRNLKTKDIQVIYESEKLPGVMNRHIGKRISGKEPDPPILRLVFLERFIYEHILQVDLLSEEFRSLIKRLKDEYLVIGLVDQLIVNALDILNGMLDFSQKGEQKDQVEQKNNFRKIIYDEIEKHHDIVTQIHETGSFKNISLDSESLRKERSKQMLWNVGNDSNTSYIYKVGDAHISDIRNLHLVIPHNVGVAGRVEYKDEYDHLFP